MKQRVRLSFLVLMQFFATAMAGAASAQEVLRSASNGEIHALIVGIDGYQFVRPLKGAVADARDLEQSLRRMGARDVTALIDDQVDRTSMFKVIDQMLARTRPGDLVVLSIAGHGAQEPERVRGSEPDGMENVFLLTRFAVNATGAQHRVMGQEFNQVIKRFEAKGARVMFIADTCHGGGLAREVDPRASEMSYRQVSRYTLPPEATRSVTQADAFVTELDFRQTAFLAAVDRYTKAPEVRIPGVEGLRGALSYAVARAFEGNSDADHNGKITMKELFSNVRQLVYQLSDQRQNIVTSNPPGVDADTEVVFELTRGIKLGDKPLSPQPQQQVATVTPQVPTATDAAPAKVQLSIGPIRIATLNGDQSALQGLTMRETPFEVVGPLDSPDIVWDPKSKDVLAGGDVIAYGMDKSDLPGVIDRAAAIKQFKILSAKSPQQIKLLPDDRLHRTGSDVEIEVANTAKRALILLNIAGDGTVQALYPLGSDAAVIGDKDYRLPLRVREPYGADQLIAITSTSRMTDLENALRELGQRRAPAQMIKMIARYAPPDARLGSVGLFTSR